VKELGGAASIDVAAVPESAYAVLADVERYHDWYPDVIRKVAVLERDEAGAASLADVTLSAPGLPIGDLETRMRAERHPSSAVSLVRVPNEPGDNEQFSVAWTIEPTASGSRVAVRLDAMLPVPRLVPIGGLGDRMAGGFVRAAKAAIESP
jgi:ribosome-associated toxin RatA of RatAB toxin-antitoxin module